MKQIMSRLVIATISIIFMVLNEANAILNGKKADGDNFKYMIVFKDRNDEYFCSGAIVGEDTVLTAAHCFLMMNNEFKRGPIWAIAGVSNLNTKNSNRIEIQVEKVFMPVSYSPIVGLNNPGDIALIKLKRGFNLEEKSYLQKLSVPKDSKIYTNGLKAVVSGFGWDVMEYEASFDGYFGMMSDQLYYLNATLVDTIEDGEKNSVQINSDELFVRTSGADSDTDHGTCRGDDGSPLVTNDGILLAVLKKNPENCNEEEGLGSYTRVTPFWDKLRRALEGNEDGIRSYTY